MYRVYKYVVLICVISIFSCNNSESLVNQPSNLLTQEQMVDIITDIHLADAGTNKLLLVPDSAEKIVKQYYGLIEKKYQIDFNTINQNFEYYLSQPPIIDSIYVKVIEKLSEIESQQRAGFIIKSDTSNNNDIVTVN